MRRLNADVVRLEIAKGNCTLAFAAGSSAVPTSYLILQREQFNEDSHAIHVELDDQAHSGYGLVARAIYYPGLLQLDFHQAIGNPPTAEIVVEFEKSVENLAAIVQGAQLILAGVFSGSRVG
jgi:hypothetical protein